MIAPLSWLVGIALMLIWLFGLATRVRPTEGDTVSRATVIAAAGLVAILGFSSAYVWGIDVARRGMDKISSLSQQAASQSQETAGPGRAEPPRARLFLRHVQLLLGPFAGSAAGGDDDGKAGDRAESAVSHRAVIGYSPEASLRLPRSYGLEEAKQGWDLLHVGAAGPQGLRVAAIAHSEPTSTRVVIRARRRAISASQLPSTTARTARDLLGRGANRCRSGRQTGPAAPLGDSSAPQATSASPGESADGGAVLDGPGAIYAFLCTGQRPRAALVFERDLTARNASAADIAVRVTPLVWRGSRWRHHHIQITSGSLVQIGAMDDAIPGITLWEVPAPSGRAELFFPPADLLASCPEWLSGERGEGFFSNPHSSRTPSDLIEPAAARPSGQARAGDSICVLPFTPPFGLEVRRLLPDLPGIAARSLWAAGLMATPALLVLLLLCARARGELSARRFHRLLTIGWVAVLFAAIAVWRLLWAHRIDMLRDYQAVGARVVHNQVLLVAVGAAVAATCALSWNTGPRRLGDLWLGILAWLTWLVVGGYALGGDLAGITVNPRLVGLLVVSLAVGTASVWVPELARRARTWQVWGSRGGDEQTWLAAVIGLAIASVVALVAALWLQRLVALKLSLAWALILLLYTALRAALTVPDKTLARLGITGLAGSVAAAALFWLDPGVTVAIVGPGFVIALLFISHDAHFAESALRQIDSYRRHHVPLLSAHAVLLFALGIAIAVWSVGGLCAAAQGESDAVFARALTLGAIHLMLFVSVLFVPAAALAYIRRGAVAAVPWLFCAALFASLWALRAPLVGAVLGSSGQASDRVAIVLDPGYALLRSENKFLSGITAWRETIVPAAGDPAHTAGQLIDGQGYFGAQLIDPGVLLSIENDYFPVLLLREAGIRGVVATTLLLLVLVVGLWLLSGTRFRHGSAAQRARTLVAAVLGVVCIYQPLASLGTLPLTGIAWPGFGLDSPSDFWLLVILVLWVLIWRPQADSNGHKRLARSSGNSDPPLDQFDSELRRSGLFRRMRVAIAITASMTVLAALLLLSRSSAFALRRPNPVDPQGRAVKPFDDLEHAIDYIYRLQCPWSQKVAPAGPGAASTLIPDDLLGDPAGGGIARFHAEMRAAWQMHRGHAVSVVDAFLSGHNRCDGGGAFDRSPWTMAKNPENPDECRMTFKTGWPEVHIAVHRNAGRETADEPGEESETEPGDDAADDGLYSAGRGAAIHSAQCRIDVRAGVLRKLRFPTRRPYRNARIRLVSRAMGAAARDRGELVSGHLAVRLRPDAGTVDVSRARAGMYFADQVRISDQLSVVITGDRTVLRKTVQADRSGDRDTWLFVRDLPGSRVQVLEASEGSWTLLSAELDQVELSRLALIVVGGPDTRSLWLFRPPTRWPGEARAVHPLLADDVATVLGERRRHYLFGGLIPEIGWVNPYHRRMSLGLDGWVHVAMTEYERARPQRRVWLDGAEAVAYCGTLAPPGSAENQAPESLRSDPGTRPAGSGPAGRPAGAGRSEKKPDRAIGRVCARSPLDGVLECRVSIQPELAIRLRHLTELVSLEPTRFGDRRSVPPVRSGFVLLRGDTGEIAAQGEFVPGRASSAYAPASPEIEKYLIRLREDRDPRTGRKLPAQSRGEASAEKVEWGQPVAVGSTIKPLLARSFELADPLLARALVLEGAPMAAARCRNRKAHALFGHCPPTDSLWNVHGRTDMTRFLSRSVNWYQAAIGLLGTAVPRGSWGFGLPREVDPAFDPGPGDMPSRSGEVTLVEIEAENAGAYVLDRALWTRHRGVPVISADRRVTVEALRKTRMWQHFEQILGRPLCTAGNKSRCRRRSARRDLCAARALPIQNPTRDLRHLVAVGPSSFDFYPRLADPTRLVGPEVDTREYLQFLRGSGLHPLGSLAQLADAFNRVIYAHAHDPERDGGYRLAASWFPVAASGTLPDWDCSVASGQNRVRDGLCDVLRRGTASGPMGPLLGDSRFVLYGAKTGTIDSLADIAENRAACEHFRTGHTIADRPATDKAQPYWLPCGRRRSPPRVNDSLFVISFAIRTDDSVLPFTLALRFQRSGTGFATLVARHYLDAIQAYFR
ncbi:MAG: hypothetical protein MJE77_44480 [Proteobacteria bacterium]|nr:hypothetical protein [Pseudomonadota bacterium]